jgi:hypothetical protein
LDSGRFNIPKRGAVVVKFQLYPDGTVPEIKITENRVGELLGGICEKAIKDSAPFKPWPPDMAKWVGQITVKSPSHFTINKVRMLVPRAIVCLALSIPFRDKFHPAQG